ncbi:MAG: hypothetical protein ACI9QN_000653 [Arcticibacterium sp.]|jgi:hypothetical protein
MFRIIFIAFLIIAFVPPVRRFLFWLIVGKQMVKEQKRANDTEEKKGKREGEVNVDYVPKNKKDKNNDNGKYIDYEEVD